MFGRLKHSSRKWCCAGFEGDYQLADERGFAVLIEKDEHLGTRFLIQSRAVAKADESRLKLALANSDVLFSLVTETGLAFCPWCGADLKRFYGKRTEELDRPGLSVPLK